MEQIDKASKKAFGRILQQKRFALGWSQRDVADRLGGIDLKTISRWEHGEYVPNPYYRGKLVDLFKLTPEEIGLLDRKPEKASEVTSSSGVSTLYQPIGIPTVSSPINFAPSQTIEFTIQQGDITTLDADVVALKYAQNFYGADELVADKLSKMGIARETLQPLPGDYRYITSKNGIRAHHILFVGVLDLFDFGYEQIRELSAQVLRILANVAPDTRRLAMTIHGVRFGLDEVEALFAQFAGYMDAILSGQLPPALEYITIVERDLARVQRLRQALDNNLVNVPYSRKSSLRWAYHLLTKLSGESLQSKNFSGYAADTRTIERAGIASAAKPHVFVAMSFKKEMDDVFHYGIQQPVRAAGFLCERIDQEAFIGDILDRVKKKIETASVVIAELTGANPNVYLEVGYAWGKERPTILLTKDEQELRFDVRGYRCLKYERIRDLEEALSKEMMELREQGMI